MANEVDTQARFSSRQVLKYGILFISFGFMAWILIHDYEKLQQSSFSPNWFIFLLGIPAFALSIFIQFNAWHFLTRQLNIQLPYSLSMKAWFVSQFGKYIPGKVFLIIGRMSYYPKEHLLLVSSAFYLEILIAVLTAACITFACLSSSPIHPSIDPIIQSLVYLIPLLLILTHPKLLLHLLKRVMKTLGKEEPHFSIPWSSVFLTMCIYCCGWFLTGLAIFCCCNAIQPTEASHFIFTTGSFALAAIVGLVVLVAPSGLGVREGILTILLSTIMPPPLAVLVSILSRLCGSGAEVLSAFLVYLFQKKLNCWDHDSK